VTFLTFDPNAIVAASGDEIEIAVTDADGNKSSLTYILTDNDIDANSATINVVTDILVPPEPITKLVVSGTVSYKDEKTPASGLTVKVLGTSSITDAEGKYIVTIGDGSKVIASSGDEIAITVEKEGNEVGKGSRTLGTPEEDGSLSIEVNVVTNLTAPPASSSLLAIEGTVFFKDGTLASNGLTVDVTNKTQNLSQSSKTGDAGNGRYSVTFLTFDPVAIVAASGDEIEIAVTDADGNKRARLVYQLATVEVLENKSTANVVLDVTQKLTVKGVVYAKDGRTPVPIGLAVKVANPFRNIEVDVTTAEGKYSAILEAGSNEQIIVTVADEEGKTIGSETYILSRAEVVNEEAIIDVVTDFLIGLIVEGNVLEADGTLLAPGVAAIAVATHEGTGIVHSENIINGKYYLTFPEDEKAMMADGDRVIIEIRSVDGKILLGSGESLLTQAEIAANLLKASDITTNRVSTFTIKGKITDAQGKPIEGAVVSALSGKTLTDANGEYALVLTDYATNPTIGQVVEVSATVNPPTFPVTQMRKRAVTATGDMIQKRGVEVTDVSITPVRVGGLTLDTSQLMNLIDKAVFRAGIPIKIRDLVTQNPQYKTMIDDMVSSLGAIGSLIPVYLVLAPIDEPPRVFEQWQNMDLENFGNPIVPYPLIGTEYLEALTKLEGNLPLRVVGNKLDLYLLAPEDADDISFASDLGTAQIERVAPEQNTITHRFQLEEELALIQLPAWPGMNEGSAFSSVTLYYTSGIEAPDDKAKFTNNVAMTPDIIDGKAVWTASPELELGKKYYYFFEVELKQPFNMFIGGEKLEVSKWVMPDPRNMQVEDRGLFSALFRTPEWTAAFQPVATAILAGQPIPSDAIPELTNYIMAKSAEIIADILNPASPNYLDPQIVSEFKTPSVPTGESLWLANFDVDAPDGNYQITVDVKDAAGNLMDSLNVQLGVDRRVAPVTLSISSGQNTIGYFREDDNTHVFARAPEATAVSTVLLKASPGSDTMGMVFQILPEGQDKWSTNNSVLALIIAIAQCVDPELAASLADGSASPEEIKALASKLSEADPGIQALCDSLDPASKADVEILLEVLGQISVDPTNLTSLMNLMNVKDFTSLAALATQFADLSVSPIAFYGKTQVMLLPSVGNYWVRVVPFDSVLNAETSDVPTKISVVPVEADIVKITQISLDANGDGDVNDRYEKGDYSVEPPELYKIFFADDEKATLTAEIVRRTGNPFDVAFQYALQSAPDEWKNIKTVTRDELKGKQQGDTIEVDWVFGDELKAAFKSLFEASADKTQPVVFVRAVATNVFNLTDPSPYVAGVLLDELRTVSFSLLLRAGLSMFSIPLAHSQASIADGAPVAIEKVGDLKTLLGEDTPVYYYSASSGKFEQASVEMEIAGDLALIALLLEDTIIKFEGEGWPNQINLVPGLNMFAVPLDAEQTVGDLKALLGEGAPVYYYHRENGKFQEAEDDMTIEGGEGYITLMLEAKTISIDGIPWENNGVPFRLLSAPSFFDPMSTLLMEVKGNVVNANTNTAFNGLSVTARHLSSNAVITDTTDDDGQFSAVFLDIFTNQSYRVGDVFKIDIHSNSGDISIEPIQYIVTQEDVKLGRIVLSNLTAKVIPKQSKLLQNWPNPFNPETWIPFQLSKDADVTITIYDIYGRLVRRFDLGYVPAGIYNTKYNAIYWNGTNDSGERVSSGVYFYHIQAGKFSASRKMVILK
jgi:hypothetical protein